MTAVSLINPYAPQPASAGPAGIALTPMQSTAPVTVSINSGNAGTASDQSGQGAGNGTGTGGAQLEALLKRGRSSFEFPSATSKSVVEAQSNSDPATEYLARQARLRAEAQATRDQTAADAEMAKEEKAQEDADKAALPEFRMPNPLPTAPILQQEDT